VNAIKTIGLLGAGVIGGGWAARSLVHGLDVRLYDPDPEAGRKVGEMLANARRAWRTLTAAPLPAEGRLTIVATPAAAAEGADFIQESAPETTELKIRLLAEASRAARPEVVIASSTSGLLPSRLATDMANPERFTVGHPFNPVYLVPLVEICGGERTSAGTRERAKNFYASLGMHPLIVRKEIDGFIADRLMEALWREALWLINDGIATAAEIDDAIRFGPGLRWAFMGTFLIYRIAGGEAGMRHFMAQFGPALKWPWTKLMDVPELTSDLIDEIAAQSDAQAAGLAEGSDLRTLERLRDDCLIGIMQALKARGFAYGSDLAAFEKSLFDRAVAGRASAEPDLSAPLALHQATVLPEWTDYNGHMTEYRYLQVLADASDALLGFAGFDAAYVAEGRSVFTVETHLCHLAQARVGERMTVMTRVLAAEGKRLHLYHELIRDSDTMTLATSEHMLLHVDTRTEKTAPPRADVGARLERIAAAQAGLPRPERAGRAIGAG
jgi:carnitine 3-dehydrogenase